MLLGARRAAATGCPAGAFYSYDGGASCAPCAAGSSLVATGVCRPSAALTAGPSDTALYLSGSQAEGVAAFAGAPGGAGFAAGVFGAAGGALSFASGASYLSAAAPAAGGALLASLPTGDAAFTASAWYKCAAGSAFTMMSWGAPSASGASSPQAVTLAAGPAYSNAAYEMRTAGQVSLIALGFNSAMDVAIDASGNVLVADADYYGTIKSISPSGIVSTIASGFSSPSGVAVDAARNIFVSDTGNNAVKKISPAGDVIILATGFNYPRGLAVDAAGNVLVADQQNNAVKKISPVGAVSVLASGFNNPQGIALDAAGNTLVADASNHAIKKISPTGAVTTIASGFAFPSGVAVDAAGNVLVADSSMIKKVSPTGAVSTLANSGLTYLFGISTDAAGNVLVADMGGSSPSGVTEPSAIKLVSQSTTQSVCDSAWHHLAVTHGAGSTAPKTYFDGRLVPSASQAFSIPADGSATLTVNQNGVTGISAGAVQEVRLYSRALSAAEVLALAQPPLAIANTVVAPPVASLQASSYAFLCAAGSSGSPGTLTKSATDNSWAWAPSPPSCAPCAAGSSAAAGATVCSPCPPGTFALVGAAACTLCPAGTFGSSAGLATAACSGACATCAAGSTTGPQSATPTPTAPSCAAGSAPIGAANACSPCPPGTYSLAGAAACSLCPAGTFGAAAGLSTAACSGPCAACATAGATAGATSLPLAESLSCTTSDSRAVPASLGVLIWPAASPSNMAAVDLVVAPLALCRHITSDAACAAAASVLGADGVPCYVVGTAEALHIEATEELTCMAN